MSDITGECFCGALQYEVTQALTEARSCHCSRCRKAFSGAGSAMSWVDPANFHWLNGEKHLKTFTDDEGFGLGFCGRCGTTLCGVYEGKVAGITLGTLNGETGVRITEHIFVGSKASWDEIGGDAPQYAAWHRGPKEAPEPTHEVNDKPGE